MEFLEKALQCRLAVRGRLLIAIDGRCGCGKSSLAQQLAADLDGNVFHMDDFYLPFAERAENWAEQIAGNMDLVRLSEEVLAPLLQENSVAYRAYDCPTDHFHPTRVMPFKALSIIEGSYSQHPALADAYDLKLFVTADKTTQEARLRQREGAHFAAFEKLWIPMEEAYFAVCSIEERADVRLITNTKRPTCVWAKRMKGLIL